MRGGNMLQGVVTVMIFLILTIRMQHVLQQRVQEEFDKIHRHLNHMLFLHRMPAHFPSLQLLVLYRLG